MTNTPSWAFVGAGECSSCRNSTFLFTHSLANHQAYRRHWSHDTPILACLYCHGRAFSCITDDLNDPTDEILTQVALLKEIEPALTDYQEIVEANFCYGCGRPETPNSPLAEASIQTDSTIIVRVHERCRVLASCCDTYRIRYVLMWYEIGGQQPDRSHYYDSTSFEGYDKCQECLDYELRERGEDLSDYFNCNWCQTYKTNDDLNEIDNGEYCDRCVERHRYTCGDCDTSYWDGDDHDCREEISDDLIHDYCYKPQPYFFPPRPKERLYFGIELEVEAGSNNIRQSAELVQSALGSRVYLKWDGSLNHGFEIVSHPHSLEAFRKDFAFDSFARFRKAGMRSWDTRTCGLHVHVSRDAFGIPYDNRTDNYAEHISTRQSHELRFIKLIYDNEAQVSKLAGRKSGYAHFNDKGVLMAKVREQGFDRHSAVNTENDSTLEVRVFKGSLRPERVLGAIEFVHAGVEYTRHLKVNGKNRALSWVAFCGYVHNEQETYPNLYALMVKAFKDERDLDNQED